MRVRMLRTIEQRDGDRFIRFAKGELVNVSEAYAQELLAATRADDTPDPAAELALDTPLGVAGITTSVIGETDTCIKILVRVQLPELPEGVTVNKDDPAGVRIQSLAGAKVIADGEDDTPVPVGQFATAPHVFRFEKGSSRAVAVFESQCTGFTPAETTVSIAAAVDAAPAPSTDQE
jgi:hypothetical protein